MDKLQQQIESLWKVLGPVGPWLAALIIILLGWIVAKALSNFVRRLLSRSNLDDKLAGILKQDTDGVEKGIATFVFWLLMLFVIILALSVAKQREVVQPLIDIFYKILAFIPNALAAAAIGFVGWIIATVVKNLLGGVLAASKIDERLGLGAAKPITNSVGQLAFFGIILMMLPSALGALKMEEISRPIAEMVRQIFEYVPKLIGGIVLFSIGYLIASIVQKVVSSVLSSIGADSLLNRLGYTGDGIGGRPLSAVISYIAMATILVLIGVQTLTLMNLGFISEVVAKIVPGYFKILGAMIVFGVAFFLANLAGRLIEAKNPFWAKVVRIAIVVFLTAAALQIANFSPLTNDTFQLIITAAIIALFFAVGVGGAIAIGLGGRDKAANWLNRLK